MDQVRADASPGRGLAGLAAQRPSQAKLAVLEPAGRVERARAEEATGVEGPRHRVGQAVEERRAQLDVEGGELGVEGEDHEGIARARDQPAQPHVPRERERVAPR